MPSATERCTTCGDGAAIVRILERDGDTALCIDGDGERLSIQLDFVPGARPGDEVLAHFGVAIARIPERA
ncbi:MAG: HypC/HybG/HupF family hydrogenase formation chaperone [Candidatus Cybelea sp.]